MSTGKLKTHQAEHRVESGPTTQTGRFLDAGSELSCSTASLREETEVSWSQGNPRGHSLSSEQSGEHRGAELQTEQTALL